MRVFLIAEADGCPGDLGSSSWMTSELSSGHQKRIKRRKSAGMPDRDIPESVWVCSHDNSTHDDGQRRKDVRQQTEEVKTRKKVFIQLSFIKT